MTENDNLPQEDHEVDQAATTQELEAKLQTAQQREQEIEQELEALKGKNGDLSGRNEKLTETLKSVRQQLQQLRDEVDRLGQPPNGYGALLWRHDDGTVDVYTSGRKMRVSLAPGIEADELQVGQTVQLNEALVVVKVGPFNRTGELCTLKEVMPADEANEPPRVLVVTHADADQILYVAASIDPSVLKAGDTLLAGTKEGFVYERVPKSDAEQLVLEEVPDIDYTDIGGLQDQIEAIRDAVELPFLHKDLFAEYKLRAPKGVLLYGPPGCGKTMVAKAVANSLAKRVREQTGNSNAKAQFLNIKGPELLNKFVGETERHIREIFRRAREKASKGDPVIVFFDEMESMFRTRGTGVSSDIETTIVPQLLSEIDGVEGLENVIVIGATNREDLIDPAVLRPGRLDVKIKVERPDAEGAVDIFSKYLTPDLPIHADDLVEFRGDAEACVKAMIQQVVNRMYDDRDERNRFLEVTYASGDKEVLYFKDFNSGAMTENIVARAKKYAIKAFLENGQRGIRIQHLLDAITDEFAENEDLPNTTNPDDWARISGKKGERIVYVRTLIKGHKQSGSGRTIDTETNLGQYL